MNMESKKDGTNKNKNLFTFRTSMGTCVYNDDGMCKEWCRGAESNCGHEAFQASALPTELPRHVVRPNETIR
jgi:hypothetical protein